MRMRMQLHRFEYAIWRWNSTATAFDYSGKPVHTFVAWGSTTLTWIDPQPIISNTATYYRCVATK